MVFHLPTNCFELTFRRTLPVFYDLEMESGILGTVNRGQWNIKQAASFGEVYCFTDLKPCRMFHRPQALENAMFQISGYGECSV
jgi:hypothetical protein